MVVSFGIVGAFVEMVVFAAVVGMVFGIVAVFDAVEAVVVDPVVDSAVGFVGSAA